METPVIKVPKKKSALVKQLLNEFGIAFEQKLATFQNPAITQKTIEDARKGLGLDEPIADIKPYKIPLMSGQLATGSHSDLF